MSTDLPGTDSTDDRTEQPLRLLIVDDQPLIRRGLAMMLATEAGIEVVISTGDKDLAQLVTPQVTLINTMAKPPEKLDVAGVQAKFGVPPERIVDYLTLIGDAVDNVPGVDKVGPKTAAKWIADHGSLDGVVAAAASIKGAVGDNLRKALDWLPTGRRLITVLTDCDLAGHVDGWPALEALALREADRAGLLDFYQRYGFRSWRKELEESLGVAPDAASALSSADSHAAPLAPAHELAHEYETVTDWPRFDHWLAALQAFFDVQSTSLPGRRSFLVAVLRAVSFS